MAVDSSHREVEIKLRAPSAAAGAELLTTHGFRLLTPRLFERNTLYDDVEGELRKSGRLLRIREVNGRSILTFKGESVPGRHKVREELETEVRDGSILKAIFERLGFDVTFVYEKYRTEFRDDTERGTATLDETAIGTFLELEGDEGWIDATAQRLGFEETDYIIASYGRLQVEWCQSHREELRDLLWVEPERKDDQFRD